MGIAVTDKGYDTGPIRDGRMDRGVAPVTALVRSARVKAGEHKPPTYEHGTWTFVGTRLEGRATKWRCPNRKCQPKSR